MGEEGRGVKGGERGRKVSGGKMGVEGGGSGRGGEVVARGEELEVRMQHWWNSGMDTHTYIRTQGQSIMIQ